jgi:hypothetical protein
MGCCKANLWHFKMKKIFATAFLGMATVALSSCGLLADHPVDRDNNNGTFEIYLLPLELHQEGIIENIACGGEEGPLITSNDIQSYDLESHEIRLTQSSFDRLTPRELAGQPFAVCVKQEPIYMGEFMALFMSRSSEGVVILWPPMEGDVPVMKIQLGYPGPDFYTGDDPRSDARILRALEQAGLIHKDLEK